MFISSDLYLCSFSEQNVFSLPFLLFLEHSRQAPTPPLPKARPLNKHSVTKKVSDPMAISLPAFHWTSEKHLSQIIHIFSLEFCCLLSLKTSYPYFSPLILWFPLPAPTALLGLFDAGEPQGFPLWPCSILCLQVALPKSMV